MPSSLVLVGHSVPRSRSLAVMLAPTMAELDGSVTRPVIPALTSWDNRGAEPKQSTAKNGSNVLLITPPDCAGTDYTTRRCGCSRGRDSAPGGECCPQRFYKALWERLGALGRAIHAHNHDLASRGDTAIRVSLEGQ